MKAETRLLLSQKVLFPVVWSVILACCLLTSSCGRKAEKLAAGERVGFVDLAAVFDEYKKVETYDKQMEELSTTKRDERTDLAEEVRKTRDSLALLSENAKAEREKELEEQLNKLAEFDEKARDELTGRRNDLLKEVFDDIEKVVQDYADENNYDMIFTSRSLIFKKDQFDVTKPVLRELNRRYEHQVGTA